MMFDVAIVKPIDGLIAISVFSITSIALIVFLRYKPKQFQVPEIKNIYYAGIILATILAFASAFLLHSWRLSLGLIAAMILVSIIGRIDEIHNISAFKQLLAQVIISAIAVYAGWMIPYISNPLQSGIIFLNHPILGIIPGAFLAFIWIIACMNAINFLDGTDGLAPATGAIACIALAGISLLPATQDIRTFELAVIGCTALTSFFIWNAPPARVYLGTIGSWSIGLFIALVSMIGGGKISTTLIVLALPILDAIFVVVHRMSTGTLPWRGDTVRHLHHRLSYTGMSKWNVVILISGCTLLFAIISVIASTFMKIIAFIIFASLFFGASSRMMKKIVL